MPEHSRSASTLYYQALTQQRGRQIGFFEMSPKQWLATLGVALGVMTVGLLVVALSTLDGAGWTLCGLGIGSLLRDIGTRRRSIALWPHLDAVIDWSRVEAQLGDTAH